MYRGGASGFPTPTVLKCVNSSVVDRFSKIDVFESRPTDVLFDPAERYAYRKHGKTNPKAPEGRHVYSNAKSPHTQSPRGATCYRISRISHMEAKQEQKTEKNPIAQRLIKAMEKPPHLTHEDIEALHQSIEEGKMPIKFDSPFDPDQHEKQ